MLIFIPGSLICFQREKKVRANHLAIKGDGSEQWPGIAHQKLTEKETDKPITYFNNKKEVCLFTCLFSSSKSSYMRPRGRNPLNFSTPIRRQ